MLYYYKIMILDKMSEWENIFPPGQMLSTAVNIAGNNMAKAQRKIVFCKQLS